MEVALPYSLTSHVSFLPGHRQAGATNCGQEPAERLNLILVTRADSGTGRRYRASADSDWRILLFVRHKPDDGRGFTSPYLFLGRVRYVSHESEKPMRITWKLDAEMPLDFFSEVKIAAG